MSNYCGKPHPPTMLTKKWCNYIYFGRYIPLNNGHRLKDKQTWCTLHNLNLQCCFMAKCNSYIVKGQRSRWRSYSISQDVYVALQGKHLQFRWGFFNAQSSGRSAVFAFTTPFLMCQSITDTLRTYKPQASLGFKCTGRFQWQVCVILIINTESDSWRLLVNYRTILIEDR